MKTWQKLLVIGGIAGVSYFSILELAKHVYGNAVTIGIQDSLEGKYFRKAVDLGCGKGWRGKELHKYSEWLIGIDENHEYLAEASQLGYYDELFESNIMQTDLPYDTDVIYLFDVIEHLSHEDGEKLLNKMRDIPNIVIVTPRIFGNRLPYQEWMGGPHLSLWTPEEFQNFGFKTRIIGYAIVASRFE